MKFSKVYVELSDNCGLNCKFCPTPKNIRPKMSLENFAKVLDEFKGSKIFTLHILGDPLVVSDLGDYLGVARDKNANIELTTNGIFLTKTLSNLIISFENLKQINISLASFFWQKKVKFDEYMSEIFYLCDAFDGKTKSRFINLRLWNYDANFKALNDNSLFYNSLTKHFGVSCEPKVPKIRLKDRVLLTKAVSFEWPKIPKNQDKNFTKNSEISTINLKTCSSNPKGYCHALTHQIGILSSGVVVPCCMDASGVINLGNIFKESFKEIYNSPRALAMRDGFRDRILVEKLCQNCEFRKRVVKT